MRKRFHRHPVHVFGLLLTILAGVFAIAVLFFMTPRSVEEARVGSNPGLVQRNEENLLATNTESVIPESTLASRELHQRTELAEPDELVNDHAATKVEKKAGAPGVEVFLTITPETLEDLIKDPYFNPLGVELTKQQKARVSTIANKISNDLDLAGKEQGRIFQECVDDKVARRDYIVNTGQTISLSDYPGSLGVSGRRTAEGVRVYVVVKKGEYPEFDQVRQLPFEIMRRGEKEIQELISPVGK